jgi:uncharacterized membrane protein YjfL (UPF0719 family)
VSRVWLVIAAIYFGLLMITFTAGTIVYDLVAVHNGWRTVSRETLDLGHTFPTVALFITGMLSFAVGCLIGHLFLYQTIQKLKSIWRGK